MTYRSEPEGDPRGAVIVIHEIWGLVPHIEAVADRFADAGYLAVAPDLLSEVGMTPLVGVELHRALASPDEATRLAAQPALREATAPIRSPEFAAATVAKLRAVVDELAADPRIDGRIAVAGFCFGGTYSFALAAADDRIRAAVPFYGTAPAADEFRTIRCPVLALYGENDPRIVEPLAQVRAAMTEAGVDFRDVVYPGAGHAFFNDTGTSFVRDAAEDSWRRALEFLAEHLG